MAASNLLKDPVFQLNLLLWMSKEQPPGSPYVRPLFREIGFEIAFIEQPFKFPIRVFQQIERCSLAISKEPEPELILIRKADRRALYFECKAQSFGPSSSTSRQGRGHLVATGPAFAEVYRPYEACQLCYVLPQSDVGGMATCLENLSKELHLAGFQCGPFSVHGMRFDGDKLIYSWDAHFQRLTGLSGNEAGVISGLTDDTSAIPLLLVYTDEDCPDSAMRSYYREALSNQIRACLLCELHAGSAEEPYEVSTEELLRRVTHHASDFLGRKRQKELREFVRQNVLRYIADEQSLERGDHLKFQDDTFTVTWINSKDREDFLDWLEDRRRTFPADQPDQGTLFDGEESLGE